MPAACVYQGACRTTVWHGSLDNESLESERGGGLAADRHDGCLPVKPTEWQRHYEENGGSAPSSGGAIDAIGSTLTTSRAQFTSKQADRNPRYRLFGGGAIYGSGGTLTTSRAQFTSNQARYGGAIYGSKVSVQLLNTLFSGNTTNQTGSTAAARAWSNTRTSATTRYTRTCG